MKKISLLLVILFLFTSCGKVVVDDGDEVFLTGILTQKALNISGPGTHILIDDKNEEHFVSSILINLSDPEYLGNKVRLMGRLDKETQLFSVLEISLLEGRLFDNEDDNLVVEKNYRNDYFGFSLSYYSSWDVEEKARSVEFVSPKYEINDRDAFDIIKIEQFQFSYEQSVFDSGNLDSPLKSFLASHYADIESEEQYLKTFGKRNFESIQIENPKGGLDVYLYRNGLIYAISYLPFDALNVRRENFLIFNEMLNSFDLIDVDLLDVGDFNDLDDVKIDEGNNTSFNNNQILPNYNEPDLIDFEYFESSAYNFKALYPKKWYYMGVRDFVSGSRYSFVFSHDSQVSENVLYSLSLFSSIPKDQFNTQRINNTEVYYTILGNELVVNRQVNGSYFQVSGDISYFDYMIKTLLSVEML